MTDDGGRTSRRRVLGLLAGGVAGLAGRAALTLSRRVGTPKEAAVIGPGREDGRQLQVLYSPAYVLAGHSFETTRKARWVADALGRDPLPGVEIVAPTPLTEAEV